MFKKNEKVDVIESKENKIISAKNAIINAIDENGNGEIDIEDIIVKGLKVPGIKIKRDEFLSKELIKEFPQDIIDKAVETSPMKAGIKPDELENIADNVIKFERNCVSGISTALGTPGGLAMAATIPADIIQYYGYMLRAAQKLMYLYGFPAIELGDGEVKIDSGTMNTLILCLGVMYGVAGAKNVIKIITTALGRGVEKKLIKASLTKGTIYPIVKSISKWFEVKMTKELFAGFFKKAIPLVGGIIGGGITFISFKPCCDKLKNSLNDTILSNPNYKDSNDELINSEINDIITSKESNA